MSNNIIDTVTQAVNSLVSALKLPDESAKANDTLGSMNFPQFSRILPYKDYDSATGLFINNKTIGFMFEARPLPGADKSIVATLEHLLRSKLPRGVPVSFHLVSSKLVGNDIEVGERTIDVQINRLRRKIEQDPSNPIFLQTVRGIGYRLSIE